MKQIQPVAIWFQGALVNANYLNLVSTSDNLVSSATFYYVLYANEMDMQGNALANGSLTMDGFDYEAYSSSPDSNGYAYSWAAGKLNLTLL
jgi:hypothetical protein